MADMFKTDEELVTRAAARKQSEANQIIVKAAIGGLLLGALAGVLVHSAKLDLLKAVNELVLIAVPALGGLGIGIAQGLERAFWKRVEAAQLRMLVEIEKRSRIPDSK